MLIEITPEEINGLIERPSEGLNTEIKGWIDPGSPDGIAKIVKATFALRNRNGGFVLIGFDDKTLQPDTNNQAPVNVRQAFHTDEIQRQVSKYASQSFEIRVGFGVRDGQEFPIIKVQDGVRSPVAVSRNLTNGSGGYLIRDGDVFFRTLASNGTPSSAKARPVDWPDIVEICFDNREADIGRFVRRHLSGNEIKALVEALSGMRVTTEPPTSTLRDRADALLIEGERRCNEAVDRRTLTSSELAEFQKGMWRIALVIDPENNAARPDHDFLNKAFASNPHFTGWPIWLDPRGFKDRNSVPQIIEKAWQSLIISLEDNWSPHVDFMRLDPKGKFFLQRIMQDDLTDKVQPGTALEVVLVIIRTAEAIAVALKMVKGLGWDDEARLGMAFKWTNLNGRQLSNWANPIVHISRGYESYEDSVSTFVQIPANTPISAIAPYVEEATRDLFLTFNGYTLPPQTFEDWTQRLIERRL